MPLAPAGPPGPPCAQRAAASCCCCARQCSGRAGGAGRGAPAALQRALHIEAGLQAQHVACAGARTSGLGAGAGGGQAGAGAAAGGRAPPNPNALPPAWPCAAAANCDGYWRAVDGSSPPPLLFNIEAWDPQMRAPHCAPHRAVSHGTSAPCPARPRAPQPCSNARACSPEAPTPALPGVQRGWLLETTAGGPGRLPRHPRSGTRCIPRAITHWQAPVRRGPAAAAGEHGGRGVSAPAGTRGQHPRRQHPHGGPIRGRRHAPFRLHTPPGPTRTTPARAHLAAAHLPAEGARRIKLLLVVQARGGWVCASRHACSSGAPVCCASQACLRALAPSRPVSSKKQDPGQTLLLSGSFCARSREPGKAVQPLCSQRGRLS